VKQVSLTEARASLGKLIDRVQAGESIAITRYGKLVAQLTSVAPLRRRIDRNMLCALTTSQRPQIPAAADLVRSMRDTDRY
jgi:prevent-host-death family protein